MRAMTKKKEGQWENAGLVGLRLIKIADRGYWSEWQGLIVKQFQGLVFVQLFDALTGTPTYAKCIKVEDLAYDNFKFFPDFEGISEYYENYQGYKDNAYIASLKEEDKE